MNARSAPAQLRARAFAQRANYRGRRRQPAPRHRFLALLTTAVVSSAVVALSTAAALPEPHTDDLTIESAGNYDDVTTHSSDRASRSTSSRAGQPAPDVWILPMHKYTLTSMFGQRWGQLHPGVDLGAAEGTPFTAVAAGTVVLCRWNAGYGNNVMIDHGGGVVTVYGHASKLLCHEGQQVRAGDRVALVGNTGHSFGSHLHFEVRQDGKPIEPLAFMLRHGVDIQHHSETAYS
ncbi:M23 family metallopeptidase [Dactylosporangium sp. CA-139066]|uniref:M23 family metallopeptidase n=1 Tax=Dactylosporangium sp. CA-139066 TaxID=3239930 RepID=UPI003D8F77D1